MKYIIQEEIHKIKRDQDELRRLSRDYMAPVQKPLQYLQQLLVRKENEFNQVGMQLKVLEVQFTETERVIADFCKTHQIQVQQFQHPDIIITSQILQEFRK